MVLSCFFPLCGSPVFNFSFFSFFFASARCYIIALYICKCFTNSLYHRIQTDLSNAVKTLSSPDLQNKTGRVWSGGSDWDSQGYWNVLWGPFSAVELFWGLAFLVTSPLPSTLLYPKQIAIPECETGLCLRGGPPTPIACQPPPQRPPTTPPPFLPGHVWSPPLPLPTPCRSRPPCEDIARNPGPQRANSTELSA